MVYNDKYDVFYQYQGLFMLKKYTVLSFCFLTTVALAISLPKLEFKNTSSDRLADLPDFKYEDFNSAYLQELRTRFNLESLVVDCETEQEKVLAVMNWVHHLWQHNGNNEPVKSDPISILDEVITNKKHFRCVEYATVLTGCLNALGLRARVLSLMTADVETREYVAGHVVTEVYLPSCSKWVLADAQFNLMPVLDGMPLNALELQQALVNQTSALELASCDPDLTSGEYTPAEIAVYKQDFIDFIGEYLYFFRTRFDQQYTQDVTWAAGRNLSSLVLVPVGAKAPEVFQIKYPFTNLTSTNSSACFYQKPV